MQLLSSFLAPEEGKKELSWPPEQPPPGKYEFALVLRGTVSVGAYTAGAIDFLIEALDCFEAE